jgi:hypothetical protein
VRRLHPAITLCLGLLFCASGVISAGGNSGRIPPRILSADGPSSEPAWLSAEPGVNRQEKLAQDALPWRVKSVIEQEVREGAYKKYGCIHYGPVDVDRAGPIPSYKTLKNLALNSKVAIRGTITDIDHGFSFYGPSSLIEIRVDEWLKKSDRVADHSFVYLIYPVAEFEAGGYRFCKTDARWGSEPQVGDELLVFPYRVPVDEARQVFLPDPDGYEVILYRKGAGSLAVPKFLKDDPDVLGVNSIEALKKRALDHIEKADRPEASN